MLNHKNYRGFTILEMLLVLSISCLLIFLPVLQIRNWQERLRIAYFFHEFERQIIGRQQVAILGGETSLIRVEQEGTAVVYWQQSSEKAERLELPAQIVSQKTTEIKFIANTGNLSKIDRFEFVDDFSNRLVTYQYQIGSGRFVKKTSKL